MWTDACLYHTSSLFISYNLVSLSRLLKGRTFPGKVMLTRKYEPSNVSTSHEHSEEFEKSTFENDLDPSYHSDNSSEVTLMVLVLNNMHLGFE